MNSYLNIINNTDNINNTDIQFRPGMNILGVTGKNGSGKSTLCDILNRDYGYTKISLSDFIKSSLRYYHKDINRYTMIEEGNRLRQTKGNDYLAKYAHFMIDKENRKGHTRFVIDSIRNNYEVKYLKETLGMKLIYIKTDISARYHRMKDRELHKKEHKDILTTIQDFQIKEKEEFENTNEYKQQLNLVFKLRDIIVFNNEELNDFIINIHNIICPYPHPLSLTNDTSN